MRFLSLGTSKLYSLNTSKNLSLPIFKFFIEFFTASPRAYFFTIFFDQLNYFSVVYSFTLFYFFSFVRGLFTKPKTLIEPFSFKRFFFFSSISFANVFGNDFFDKSTPVMISISAIISC